MCQGQDAGRDAGMVCSLRFACSHRLSFENTLTDLQMGVSDLLVLVRVLRVLMFDVGDVEGEKTGRSYSSKGVLLPGHHLCRSLQQRSDF